MFVVGFGQVVHEVAIYVFGKRVPVALAAKLVGVGCQ
jgi:hypothetical protein